MADEAADMERRIADLRAFEREYRARLRAYFTQQLGDLNLTGDLLDRDQRRQVEAARDALGTWDLWRGDDAVIDRERVLADQVRVLLAVIDQAAPAASGKNAAGAAQEQPNGLDNWEW